MLAIRQNQDRRLRLKLTRHEVLQNLTATGRSTAGYLQRYWEQHGQGPPGASCGGTPAGREKSSTSCWCSCARLVIWTSTNNLARFGLDRRSHAVPQTKPAKRCRRPLDTAHESMMTNWRRFQGSLGGVRSRGPRI